MFINYRERHRRMAETEDESWRKAEEFGSDPGLRDRYESMPRAPIRLLCCQLSKEVNHGGILRAAEAFRIEKVIFSPESDRAIDGSGSRGTKRWQPNEWKGVEEALQAAKLDGYQTVALSLSARSVSIDAFEWQFPLALVIGGELFGIEPEIEAQCDASVAIPLYGLVQSLNVAVATAIALREAVKAYTIKDPSFEPARCCSRSLLGLPK